MKKPLMILSLPNSGSTWFGNAIAEALQLRYFMEYFNPLRNPRHESVLMRNFGCELALCYKNIITPGDLGIHNDIKNTFGQDQYQMTKEVFSPFKLPVFVRHFNVVVLLRSAELSFPPRRIRMWSFYEHIWCALLMTGRYRLEADLCRDRALEAFDIVTHKIQIDAADLLVPVIYYDDFMRDDFSAVSSLFNPIIAERCRAGFRKIERPLVEQCA